MVRVSGAVVLVLAVALVGSGVLPAAASSAADTQSSQDVVRLSEPEPDEDLANGTGGKVVRGRENNEDQQFDGKTTFRVDDHAPGASGNSFNIYAEGFSENIRMHWNVVQQPDFDFSSCTSDNARAFGIDRGNDNEGTYTDESLLTAYRSVTYTEDNIFVEFYKEEQLAGGPVNITVDDQIVSRVANCLGNPDEPGWYRMTGYVNGSTKMDTQTDYAIYGAARFVYICEGCDSREAAIEKLGPPPTTCPTTDEFDQDSRQWTCRTEDGTYYTNDDKPGSDDSDDSTPTPTATPGSTATATPTATPGSGGEDTSTATPTPSSASTPTDESKQSQQNQQTQTTQQNQQSTQNQQTQQGQQNQQNAQQNQQQATRTDGSAPTTPTIAQGAGFSGLLAVTGLLVAALLALRRD